MTIKEINNNLETEKLKNAAIGSIFFWENSIYMKLPSYMGVINDDECNIIDLELGTIICANEETVVTLVDATLTYSKRKKY